MKLKYNDKASYFQKLFESIKVAFLFLCIIFEILILRQNLEFHLFADSDPLLSFCP
jgi:hypothetical protein